MSVVTIRVWLRTDEGTKFFPEMRMCEHDTYEVRDPDGPVLSIHIVGIDNDELQHRGERD